MRRSCDGLSNQENRRDATDRRSWAHLDSEYEPIKTEEKARNNSQEHSKFGGLYDEFLQHVTSHVKKKMKKRAVSFARRLGITKTELDSCRHDLLNSDVTDTDADKPNTKPKAIASALPRSGLIRSETDCCDRSDGFIQIRARLTARTGVGASAVGLRDIWLSYAARKA